MSQRFVLLGGTGFIGINLAHALLERTDLQIVVAGRRERLSTKLRDSHRVDFQQLLFDSESDYSLILRDGDIVVHLVSSTTPASSNVNIASELGDIAATARMLDACVNQDVSKVIYLSSGGAVYGPSRKMLTEQDGLDPITSYGLQKLSIEKLLQLYHHQYGLEYRIARPSNPYGPWQDPGKGQGIISVFVHNALVGKPLTVFGDGSVVRDFIYIDDLTEGLDKVLKYEGDHRIFNIGSGRGTSISQIACEISSQIPGTVTTHAGSRAVDVPSNILDISLCESELGFAPHVGIEEGIRSTIAYQEALLDGEAG